MKADRENKRIRIHAENLSVSYQDFQALRIDELEVEGKIIAIIGHNGSGKSTLIKTLLGLLEPRSGEVIVSQQRAKEEVVLVPEHDMAFSPETGAIFADLSVESYLKLWCRIKRGNGNYYRKQGRTYLERLDITQLLPKLGRELSKGERRRVQIAVGFLCQPNLFLFDEPFDGMDIAQSNHLSSVMLNESEKMAMIVSSHRMEVVERLADLIIVLRQGRVLTVGSLEEVCQTLSGMSVIISKGQNTKIHFSALSKLLHEEYESCLIHQVGNQLMVTGREVSEESLQGFLLRTRIGEMDYRVARPSLVDAMHYHLKNSNGNGTFHSKQS